MKEARVIKYQSGYPRLNKKLFTEKTQVYKVALIYIRLDELQERGAKVLKIGKPNFGGTQITFAPVESAEEYQSELKKIISDGKEIGVEFEKVKN
ncbi:MAG: hypothetical protein K1W34_14065 [Lachnospiraceae bacterium]